MVAGLGKLLPGHPMYEVLKSTFDKAIGPLFGMPSSGLRLVIGMAELLGGLAILLIPWAEFLGLSAGMEYLEAQRSN